MKKHRRLILILASIVALLAIVAAVLFVVGSRKVTSYGTAKQPSSYAPAVRQMVNAQQELAGAFAARFAQQPEVFTEVQQSFDNQSAQANSRLGEFFGSTACPIGQVRYSDVLNLSVNASTADVLSVSDLLEEASADGVIASGKVNSTSVLFSKERFRVEVTSFSAGDRVTYRFTVPNLPDAADRAAYVCYPVAQVPLSSVQQLG